MKFLRVFHILDGEKANPRIIVNVRKIMTHFFLLVCEDHTAIAIVKLLASSASV